MYRIEFSPMAFKELNKLPKTVQKQVVLEIEKFKNNPLPTWCKKLSGVSAKIQKRLDAANLYRVRSGDYRVIYSICNKKIVIMILKVGSRKDIYDFLKRY